MKIADKGTRSQAGQGNIHEEQRSEVGSVRGHAFQMTIDEAREKLDVVSCTFILNSIHVHVFVSTSIIPKLTTTLTSLNENIVIEMMNENRVTLKVHYKECRLEIYETVFPINLKLITTKEFDLVIGMDWLSTNEGNLFVIKII